MLKFARFQTTLAAEAYKSFNSIPGPKAFPLLGSIPHYLPIIGKYDPTDVFKSGLLKFKEFGPIIKETFFGHDAVFLYSPTDIETLFRTGNTTRRSHLSLGPIRKNSEYHANAGILHENGTTWSQLRSGSQQSWTSEAFESYLPKLDEFTLRLNDKITNDRITQEVIQKDFLLALLAHNCDSVCYMLFGFELDSINDILNEDALTTKVIHSSTYFNRMMVPMDNGLMLWKFFPTAMYKKVKSSIEMVELIPKREVLQRVKNKPSDGPGILNNWIREGRLDPKAMITLLSDFLLAGIDTTSYTLAFVLYNLTVNKKAQEKLYQELRTLDPDLNNSVSLSMETLSKATYLKRVVKESMRLFPVSVGTSRVLNEPCVIGGYKIPPNVTIITMNQVTCRLDEYVDKPNDFIPERFEPGSGFRKIQPYTILPFGHGPRACIGRRVAELSMYSFLFRLLRRYEIDWVGTEPLGCISYSITEPNRPLHFRFTPKKL